MKRALVFLAACVFGAASAATASVTVTPWKPAGANRYLLFCVADLLADLPTSSIPDGVQCYVLGDGTYSYESGVWTLVSGGGGGGAPATVDYLVKTADSGLSAERAVTDTATVTWDWGTSGQAKATAVDLSCTNCVSGAEIDESGLAAVPTATALAANPADCSTADGTEFAWRINASGDLSCAAVAFTSKTLSKKTSSTTINNSTTDTAIFSYTIPANTVDANGGLRLHLDNEWLNNTGASRGFIIKAKLGGTTVIEFTTGNSWAGTSATRSLIEVDLRLDALGATNSQIVTLRWQMQSSVGAFGTLTTGTGRTGTTSPPYLLVNSGTLSKDMTASQVLEVSITLSTNSTNLEWKSYAGTLELLNP